MKSLHTSDWHIGKQLLNIDFLEDLVVVFWWCRTLADSLYQNLKIKVYCLRVMAIYFLIQCKTLPNACPFIKQ